MASTKKHYDSTNDFISKILNQGKSSSKNNNSTKGKEVDDSDWEKVEPPKETYDFVHQTEAKNQSYADVVRDGFDVGEKDESGFVGLTKLNQGQGRSGKI